MMFYLYSEYLILAFKQINYKLYVIIRFRKISLLRNTIIEHYFLSKICYLYNNTFKYFVFLFYIFYVLQYLVCADNVCPIKRNSFVFKNIYDNNYNFVSYCSYFYPLTNALDLIQPPIKV